MFCRECGKENPDTDQVCGACGASLIKKSAESPTVLICNNCRYHNPPYATYCLRCGSMLVPQHRSSVSWDLIKWLILFGLLIIIILQLGNLTASISWWRGDFYYPDFNISPVHYIDNVRYL